MSDDDSTPIDPDFVLARQEEKLRREKTRGKRNPVAAVAAAAEENYEGAFLWNEPSKNAHKVVIQESSDEEEEEKEKEKSPVEEEWDSSSDDDMFQMMEPDNIYASSDISEEEKIPPIQVEKVEYTGFLRKSQNKRQHSEIDTVVRPQKRQKVVESEDTDNEIFPETSATSTPEESSEEEESVHEQSSDEEEEVNSHWRKLPSNISITVPTSALSLLLRGEKAFNSDKIRSATVAQLTKQFTPGYHWVIVGSQFIGGKRGTPSHDKLVSAFDGVKALKKYKKQAKFEAHYASNKKNSIQVACLDPFLRADPFFDPMQAIAGIRENASRLKYIQESNDLNSTAAVREKDSVIDMAVELADAMTEDPARFPMPLSKLYVIEMLKKAVMRGETETRLYGENYWLVFVNEVLLQLSVDMHTENFSSLFYMIDTAAIIHGPVAVITMLYQLCMRQSALDKAEETENLHRKLYLGKYLENAERLMMRLLFFGRTLDISGKVLPPCRPTGVHKFLTYEHTQQLYFNSPDARGILNTWKVGSSRMNFVWGEIEA